MRDPESMDSQTGKVAALLNAYPLRHGIPHSPFSSGDQSKKTLSKVLPKL
jgi:hypothetical protein